MIDTIKLIYSKFTPNLFWSFASKGVAGIAFILIDVFLARSLEPSLYGGWQRFFSLITVLLYLVYFGIPAAAEAFTAQNNNHPELKNVLKKSLVLQILFSGIATGLVLLLRNQIASLLNQPHFGALILLALPYLFAGALEEYLKSVFVGLKRAKYHFYMNVFSFGFRLIFLVILFLFFKDLPYIILAYTLAIALAVITGFLLYIKHFKNLPAFAPAQPKLFKKIFIYSLPLAFILIVSLSLPEINVQMLGMLTSSTEVAYFGVGKQLTSKLPQIALAVAMGIMPDYAQISGQNLSAKKKNFMRVMKLNLILFGGITAGIVLLSPWAIPAIYGSDYASAVLPLQILSVNVLIGSFSIYLTTLLNYQGKANQLAGFILLSLVINILLNLLLIPKLGAAGAALALTITSLPFTILLFMTTKRIFSE